MNINNCHNILVIVAHPDDEILGLGATIRRFVNNGVTANAVILGEGLTSRKNKREDTEKEDLDKLKNQTTKAANIIGYSNVEFCDLPDNRFDSVDLLDVIKKILIYVEKYNPDTIFTHHYGDLNIDHRVTFDAVITACRPVNEYVVKNIICFETPSSTEWNFKYGESVFRPNLFYDVAETLKQKLVAMDCYLTESTQYPHPRSRRALEVIANRWGSVVGVESAEAFEIVRCVKEDIHSKLADMNDIELLFKWVNDDSVRKNSFNSNPISYSEHTQWFSDCLSDKSVEIYIYYLGNTPIGQARLMYSEKESLIDYSVDRRFRGRGFGKYIIHDIELKTMSNHPEITSLIAKVRECNIVSQKIFEDNDYEKILFNNGIVVYSKNMIMDLLDGNTK